MTFNGPRERPTAVHGTRDLSEKPGRASAPPEARGITIALVDTDAGVAIRERARRRLGVITETCVCGGPEIEAVTFLPHDIVAAVQRHQIEPVHIAWDLAHGIPLAAWQMVAPR